MKPLRIFVLVLLAVLLPLRGAVAASLLCAEGAGQTAAATAHHQDHHAVHQAVRATHEMQGAGDVVHGAAGHHDAGVASPEEQSSPADHTATCKFCASGCCTASLLPIVPTLPQPALTAGAALPSLAVPAFAFHSGGQDRPPRTL